MIGVLPALVLAAAGRLDASAPVPGDGSVRTTSASEVDGSGPVRDVRPRVRLAWLLLQTVPSPGVAFGERGARGMLSWQLTPFLYSWAMDSRLVPLRFFVVEPLVRQSGSVEWFVSPLFIGRARAQDNFGVRSGLRAYLPLTDRGDGWSLSVGASGVVFRGAASPSVDLGVYTLFGALGLVGTVSPWFEDSRFELSLRLRYF